MFFLNSGCFFPGETRTIQTNSFFWFCEITNVCEFAEKKKAYTTTTERKSFLELFWPQRRTFQAGGGHKNLMKNQENQSYHRNLSSVAPIFFGKEKFCTGAGRCMLSFSQIRLCCFSNGNFKNHQFFCLSLACESAFFLVWFAETTHKIIFVGALRGNTIRGNTTRNSERKMAL